MFNVIRISPVHCQITDGIIGTRMERLPMAYVTEAWAKAKAGLLSAEDYANYGDDTFIVRRCDEPVYGSRFAIGEQGE